MSIVRSIVAAAAVALATTPAFADVCWTSLDGDRLRIAAEGAEPEVSVQFVEATGSTSCSWLRSAEGTGLRIDCDDDYVGEGFVYQGKLPDKLGNDDVMAWRDRVWYGDACQ